MHDNRYKPVSLKLICYVANGIQIELVNLTLAIFDYLTYLSN